MLTMNSMLVNFFVTFDVFSNRRRWACFREERMLGVLELLSFDVEYSSIHAIVNVGAKSEGKGNSRYLIYTSNGKKRESVHGRSSRDNSLVQCCMRFS